MTDELVEPGAEGLSAKEAKAVAEIMAGKPLERGDVVLINSFGTTWEEAVIYATEEGRAYVEVLGDENHIATRPFAELKPTGKKAKPTRREGEDHILTGRRK